MPRPVTLFTGQWADLPLATLAEKVAGWGFDGLELACWGDHFDVVQALSSDGYVRRQRELLEQHGLQCLAISTHLVGQCVCDPIDERHKAILPPRIWGDGKPEGVRRRAAEDVANAARAAKLFGVDVVNASLGGLGYSIALCGIAPLLAAIFLVPRLPESSGRELDDISPSEV